MQSQALQRLGHRRGKTGRGNHGPSKFRGELFEPGGMIDGGTDDREVEPGPGAGVAVSDFAQMQGKPEVDLLLFARFAREIARGYRGYRGARRFERGRARFSGGVVLANLENGQHRVADEL